MASSEFEGVNATVFGISVDSIPTLKEFRTKYRITIDLLRDFKREETFFSKLLTRLKAIT